MMSAFRPIENGGKADEGVERGDKLRHLGHLYALGDIDTGDRANRDGKR